MAHHSRLFGQDVLCRGDLCVLRDLTAMDAHRSPQHKMCKVRKVQFCPLGFIQVGVSFYGPDDSSQPEKVDGDGYALKVSHWTFPCHLRLAQDH